MLIRDLSPDWCHQWSENCSPFRSTWTHSVFLWSSCCWTFSICVVCCRQLLVFLSIFFCQLYCMSFELKFLFYHFSIFKLVFTTQMYTKYNDNNNNNMQQNIPGNLQKRHRNVSILWFFLYFLVKKTSVAIVYLLSFLSFNSFKDLNLLVKLIKQW